MACRSSQYSGVTSCHLWRSSARHCWRAPSPVLTLGQRRDPGAKRLDIAQVAQLVIDSAIGAVLERGRLSASLSRKPTLHPVRQRRQQCAPCGRAARLSPPASGLGYQPNSVMSVSPNHPWPAKSRPETHSLVVPLCSVAVDISLPILSLSDSCKKRTRGGETHVRTAGKDGLGSWMLVSSCILGTAHVERLWTGGRWCEGPAWFGGGRYLVWSIFRTPHVAL